MRSDFSVLCLNANFSSESIAKNQAIRVVLLEHSAAEKASRGYRSPLVELRSIPFFGSRPAMGNVSPHFLGKGRP